MDYFFVTGNGQRGPFPPQELLRQGVRPETLVWCEGMPQWQRADSIAEFQGLFPPTPPIPPMPPRPPSTPADQKLAAGLCAILIGSLGIHKFILGMTTAGVIMLLVTLLTCGIGGIVMHVIGIVEGIIYLTKSDAEFYETYMVQKKEWF